jgi:phosphoribosylformylglycinamidine cyclo-ligase
MTNSSNSKDYHDAKKETSKILYHAARETWKNREGHFGEVVSVFDDFSGLRAIDVSHLPSGTMLGGGSDGVGTKMEIAERMNDFRTIAYDLFAMVCDDAVVRGAEPVLLDSILDTNYLVGRNGFHINQIEQIAEGYVKAAREANVVVINGECAELGSRVGGYGEFNSNWGASVVWFANRDRLLSGKEIREGDYLVALEEKGFRSNGLSLVRKVLSEKLGDEWHNKKFEESTYGQRVLTPSQIYTKAVVEMFGGFDKRPKTEIHGVAHITGGGIPEKIGRMLRPSCLSARLDSLIYPSRIVKEVQRLGKISNEEAYKTWSMGNGMIIATPEPEKVRQIASEHEIYAKIVGQIVKEDIPKISLSTEKENLVFKID